MDMGSRDLPASLMMGSAPPQSARNPRISTAPTTVPPTAVPETCTAQMAGRQQKSLGPKSTLLPMRRVLPQSPAAASISCRPSINTAQ